MFRRILCWLWGHDRRCCAQCQRMTDLVFASGIFRYWDCPVPECTFNKTTDGLCRRCGHRRSTDSPKGAK